MFENFQVLTPDKKKVIPFYGLISLLITLMVFHFGLYSYLLDDVDNKSKSAESALTDRMDQIFIELKQVTDEGSLSCEKEDIKSLRHKTFYSPIFKEFGLFDENFQVYCSDFGPQYFSIFSTIRDRIKESKGHKTVSLARSHTLSEMTFFAFYLGDNGIGVNGLAPPSSLSIDLDHLLLPDYPYELTLGKLALVPNKLKAESSLLYQKIVSLDDWSMTLEIFLPMSIYWNKAGVLLPFAFLSWGLLWILLCVIQWVFIYYCHTLSYCLRKAIINNAMEVYYQPIVSLEDNKIHDMEALIRWQSPYHGPVSALSIIEMTDRLGLIDDLTWMVIRKVGQFYRKNQTLLNDVTIAVNIDRHSLLKENFLPNLQKILEEYQELKGRLGLEVTETSALTMVELPVMVSRFEHIKALGISLSVDDFGTGYSGLDFLRRFPYDILKLDRVFTSCLQEDPLTQQILESVVTLARTLNMKIVAEGIEHQAQLEAIQELGVDSVQGYYFSMPLPANHIIEWLDKRDDEG